MSRGSTIPSPRLCFVCKKLDPIFANWLKGAYQDNDRVKGHVDSNGFHLKGITLVGPNMSAIENIFSSNPNQSISSPSCGPSLPTVPPPINQRQTRCDYSNYSSI